MTGVQTCALPISGLSLFLPQNTLLKVGYNFGSSGPLASLTISDGCKFEGSNIMFFYSLATVTVEQNAAVTFAANSFNQSGNGNSTFNFYGSTNSSLAVGFIEAGSAKLFNLKLNVDWLTQAGDDPQGGSNTDVKADTRTPKPIYDTSDPKKVIGGTWMGVNWKSITFVNPDGTEITQQDIDRTYQALKETGAVWGDPTTQQ